MARKFKTVDYEVALDQTVTVEERPSPNHVARFIVSTIAQLDLSKIYARYAPVGGEPIDPKISFLACAGKGAERPRGQQTVVMAKRGCRA